MKFGKHNLCLVSSSKFYLVREVVSLVSCTWWAGLGTRSDKEVLVFRLLAQELLAELAGEHANFSRCKLHP